MTTEKTLIRSILDPTIILDEISMMDVETGSATQIGSPTSPVHYSKQLGGIAPLVQINNKVIDVSNITSMEINCSGVRPLASVSFILRDKSFYSTSYPKDGDVMSIFVRSKDDLFKPIRNDYDITNVYSQPRAGGGENTPDDLTITGTLRIPGLDASKCFSKKGTSFKTLLNTSSDLNLGFASNDTDTEDEQVWICPSDTVSDFIYNVSLSSWKNESSFFTYFIDHYYNLNFVNVEPLFSEKSEIEDALSYELLSQDFGKDSELAKFKGKTVLSNWDDMSGTNFFIQTYSLQNYSASINLSEGYKRYVTYYDAFLKENTSLFVDPNTTEGAENDKVLMKGRSGENFYLDQIQNKWFGAQYGKNGENSHSKINYAKINNYQNNVHLDKMQLLITLENVNFNLRRYQPIPVVIVVKKDYVRKRINEPVDETQEKTMPNKNEPTRTKSALDFEETPFVLDQFLTGNYVIKDIIYRYTNGEFKQDCVLIRREWSQPAQMY